MLGAEEPGTGTGTGVSGSGGSAKGGSCFQLHVRKTSWAHGNQLMEQLKGGESKVFSQVAVVSRTERLSSEFAGDGVLDLRGLPSASTFAATSARVKTDQPTLEYTSTVQHKKKLV